MEVPDHATHGASTAAAIVNDRGEVLMVQRKDSGDWEPPGGMLEPGETIEDGLVREVFEETGLLVEPERVTGVYKNMSTLVLNITFRCRVVGGELQPSAETRDFLWAHPNDVRNITTEVFAYRMLDAFRDDAPIVRVHDGHNVLPSRSQRFA